MLTFYADRVDYFAQGPVTLEAIRKDRQAYRKRWPEITLALVGDIAVADADASGRTAVTFKSAYTVGSPVRAAHATGTLESTLIVARIDGAARIVDQKEIAHSDRRQPAPSS